MPNQTAETSEDAAYRARAHTWLAENAPRFAGYEAAGDQERAALSKSWTRAKWEAGYSGIDTPKEFGGAGGTAREAKIYAEEERGYAVPLSAVHGLALTAVMRHGTSEQKARWGKSMHSGEYIWTQLFSEPSAGSDLAALRTRAIKQGDKYIVNGQKIWSSGAHRADYGFMVARSNSKIPKHKGLSFFFINMRQPGITVRPIRQMTGDSEFNEVFFVDAVVPEQDRIGAEGEGWAVTMTVLTSERTGAGGAGFGEGRESPVSTANLMRAAAEAGQLDRAAVREKIALWHAQQEGVKHFGLRMAEQMRAGGGAPATMPVMKLTSATRNQLAFAFLMDMQGYAGVVQEANDPHDRFYDYTYSPIWRIAGGADEVLRNQLSERALDMPGDMRADKDIPFDEIPH